MKLLIVSKTFIPYSHHQKLLEISKLGIELHLVSPKEWAGVNIEINPSEVKSYSVHLLPIALSGRNHLYFYRTNIDEVIRKITPDIVFLHEEPYSFVTYQWLKNIKKYQIPAIFLTAQNIYKNYPFPFSYFEKYAFKNCAAATSLHQDGVEILKKKGFDKSVRVLVEVGINPEEFKKINVDELRIKYDLKDKFVIGYVGRCVKVKGIDLLLNSVKILKTKGIDNIKAVFIGSGNENKLIKNFTKNNNLEDNILVFSYMDSKQIPQYMNLFDCLILPSREYRGKIFYWKGGKEQFGRVLTEAMACEVPVIGSSSGEIPNVIGNAGLVFRENDFMDLAEKIELLIKDKKLKNSLAQAGRKRAIENYSCKIAARQLVEFCTKILNESSN